VPGGAAAASARIPGTDASASNGRGILVKKGTGGQPLPLRISKLVPEIVTLSPKRASALKRS